MTDLVTMRISGMHYAYRFGAPGMPGMAHSLVAVRTMVTQASRVLILSYHIGPFPTTMQVPRVA